MRNYIGSRRAANLFSRLDDSIDAVMIVNARMPFLDQNFRYLTDVRGGLFEGSYAIATSKDVTILTSELEEGIARRSGCRLVVANSAKQMETGLKRIMRGKKVVGLNMSGVSYTTLKYLRKNLKGIKLKDVSKPLNKARMIKDPDEVERIRRACRIASKVAEEIPETLEIGMSEKEAAAEVDYLLKQRGADGLAFDTIAAFGPATALPHYQPGDRRLRKGSTALFDFGANYGNYKSDITRTYFTKPIDGRLGRIYEIVAEAQMTAVRCIRPGVRAKIIDIAARNVIAKAGYGKQFIHSTGHGLGISEHDPGILAERSKDILRENMIVTVEPGIYLSGKGGVRIEDDILINGTEGKFLTTANRDLISI
jgi:Xaa-Pro aminopeptidase